VPEARLAAELDVTAMHDPTEGGVVGAAWEMAEASRCGFRIVVDQIPVRAATSAICAALGVDPLRLIASGALLIACADGPRMVEALQARNIPAAQIGAMTPSGPRRLILPNGTHSEVTQLDRDEVYRILEQRRTEEAGRREP
jgi:hydrogenase expression/formation protein HypE